MKLFGIALILLLAGCNREMGKQDPSTPPMVRLMMAGKFPADGQVHVQSRGQISIKPNTPVCYYPHGFVIDSDELFPPLGQSSTNNSGDRQQEATPESCDFHPDTVLITSMHSENRDAKSYKSVWAVWQGKAIWVGGIERIGGPRLDAYVGSIPVNDIPIFSGPTRAQREQESKGEVSKYLDEKDLGRALVNYLKRAN